MGQKTVLAFKKIREENGNPTLEQIAQRAKMTTAIVHRASQGKNIGLHKAQLIAKKGFKKEINTDTLFPFEG